jgi:hypothetical protein
MTRQIDTNGYKGQDRRNGGRFKMSLRDWVGMIMLALTLTTGATVWYSNTTSHLIAVADDCEANTEINKQQTKEIEVLKTKLYNFEGILEQVRQGSQENQKLLYKILGKLDQ